MSVTDMESKRKGADGEEEIEESPEDEEAIAKGKSIEERAAEGEHEEGEEEEDGQFRIAGTKPGMTTNVGGRKPTFSEAKLDSLPLRLAGQFNKEDRVRLLVECVVRDVRMPDDYGKDGQIVRTRRVHIFKPIAVEPVEGD